VHEIFLNKLQST